MVIKMEKLYLISFFQSLDIHKHHLQIWTFDEYKLNF